MAQSDTLGDSKTGMYSYDIWIWRVPIHSRGESFFFLGEKYNPQRRKPDNLKTFSRSRVGIRAAQISPLAAGVGDPRIRI